MIELMEPYEDTHGITHAAAVIVVRHASSNCNQNFTLNATIGGQGEVSYNDAQPTTYVQVSFQAYLYPSLAALQSGKQPMIFRGRDNTDNFHFQPVSPVDNAAELIAACEQYLTEQVINKQPDPLPEEA